MVVWTDRCHLKDVKCVHSDQTLLLHSYRECDIKMASFVKDVVCLVLFLVLCLHDEITTTI